VRLPRLRDLDPEDRDDPPYLPHDIERELANRLPHEPGDWLTLPPTRSPDREIAVLAVVASLAALIVAVVALIVAGSLSRDGEAAATGSVRPLVLGNGGLNIIDCVADRLQLFIPLEGNQDRPPEVRLKAGQRSITVVPEPVQGGYYAALDVKRGEVAGDNEGPGLQVHADEELVVRVTGFSDPTLVDVHGRQSARSDGEEVCDPTFRRQLSP